MSKERSQLREGFRKGAVYLIGGLVILGISIGLINEALSVSAA